MAGDASFKPNGRDEEAVRRAFRAAALSPDVIKGNRHTEYESIIEEMNATFDPLNDPLVDEREKKLCKTWHYYDEPIRFGNRPKPGVAGSNALKAMERAREKLAAPEAVGDRNPTQMQAWWLCWIEHVAGDLHQPLHCTSSFEFQQQTGDAGGNLFPIKPARSKLHGYWDDGIRQAIEMQVRLPEDHEAVTQRWIAAAELQPASAEAENLDVSSWIAAGAALADEQVYMGISPDKKPSARYAEKRAFLSKKQAVLAGYRLANVLNGILDPTP
jgi:hypothetical protein